MQKLKVLVPMAGMDYCHKPGEVIEFEDAEAGRLIAAGHAEALPADDSAKPAKPAKK